MAERLQDFLWFIPCTPIPTFANRWRTYRDRKSRIRFVEQPDYFKFVVLMSHSYFIITDSDGIQEEAPSLQKPVLVVRNVTERPDAIESGAAILVGTDRQMIVAEASRLLEDTAHYSSMIIEESPFGDGHSSERIVDLVEIFL